MHHTETSCFINSRITLVHQKILLKVVWEFSQHTVITCFPFLLATQTIKTTIPSSAPTMGLYPEGNDTTSTTVLIVVILALIAIIILLLVIMVIGLVMLYAKGKKSSKSNATTDEEMANVYNRGICMDMHIHLLQYLIYSELYG